MMIQVGHILPETKELFHVSVPQDAGLSNEGVL